MNQQLLIAFVTVWLLHIMPAMAQGPSFSLPTYNEAQTGSVITVPVTVQDFDGIVSIGMVLEWDPSVIKYLNSTDFNSALPNFGSDDLGEIDVITGSLRFVWWNFTTSGHSLMDGDTLFSMRFRVVGPISSGTSISFTELNPQLIFEIQQADGTTFSLHNTTLENGFVAVGYTVASKEVYTRENAVSVGPNPIAPNQDLNIWIENVVAAQEAIASLFDMQGKQIAQQEIQLQSGKTNYVFSIENDITDKTLWLLIEIEGHYQTKQILCTAR